MWKLGRHVENMKFSIVYTRKERTMAYSTLEIGLIQEFDTGDIEPDIAYARVRDKVGQWMEEEKERILSSTMKKPESEEEIQT
jgi:hypothetical protein